MEKVIREYDVVLNFTWVKTFNTLKEAKEYMR